MTFFLVYTLSWQMVCAALKEEVSVMVKSSPADLVTVTDQKVEEMIISSIKEKYPTHRQGYNTLYTSLNVIRICVFITHN